MAHGHRAAVTADTGLYLANSLNSLRIEGQKTVAIEIVQQLGWDVPDWIIIPGGNLGNVSALGRGLELMRGSGPHRSAATAGVAQARTRQSLYLSYFEKTS